MHLWLLAILIIGGTPADRAAIETLHQHDVAATLSGKVDDLANLWDNDAVRIQPDRRVEVGKTTIYANDKRRAKNGGGATLCYNAEIQQRIDGDYAFEWGYFSYKEKADSAAMRGKVSRVMKRQPDGSWRFISVMGFPETNADAAPLSHPCR